MATVLELNDIYKYYGGFAANIGINLSVKAGTVHAIVGENGAGKSTLMNMLAGVLQPTSGTILLAGTAVNFQNAHDATLAGIGMVQQEFMLFDSLTVLENIVMGFEDTGKGGFLDKRASEKRIQQICEEYGFHFDLKAKVGSLPVVLQQQVEIVKVLYKHADIIILDEPTAVLPPQEVESLFKAIRFLVKQGKTVLFITHKLKEVLAVSDSITVMKSGRVVDTISAAGATERQLTSMMVGRDVMLNIEKHPPASDKTVLEVRKLTVRDSRGVTRVKDISFALRAGEILGIVGIAGNGQNELVESITGMCRYDSGEVLLGGVPLPQASPRANRESQIGYVPQDRRSVGSSVESTQVENAAAGKHLHDFKRQGVFMDYAAAADFARRVVTTYDVKTQSIDLPAGSLSGGNLQKLIVGREFSQNNRVLVIEDPTRGIDVGAIEFIWGEIVRQAEQEGVAVLLITYDLNEAITLSDRLMVMYEGGIHKTLTGPGYDEKEIGYYMLGGEDDEAEAG